MIILSEILSTFRILSCHSLSSITATAISVVCCTNVIHLIAIFFVFAFCTFHLVLAHTRIRSSSVSACWRLLCSCLSLSRYWLSATSSFVFLWLASLSPVAYSWEPFLTCHSPTWAGMWRVAYRDALALSLFSDVVLIMLDLKFACGCLQPVGTWHTSTLLISHQGLEPFMAELFIVLIKFRNSDYLQERRVSCGEFVLGAVHIGAGL